MAEHLEYLKEVIVRPVEFHRREVRRLEKTLQKINEHPGDKFAYVSELREETVKVKGVPRHVRRVFVTAHDTMHYTDIGWVLCDDMELCMVCSHPFGMIFDPQVHCHACGNIVCTKCHSLAVVQEIQKLGPVPVCTLCDWGQDRIFVTPSPPDMRRIAPVPMRPPKYANINLWHYGRVVLHDYQPVFVIRTRRVNKSRLYVNVCMCADVPINPKGIITQTSPNLRVLLNQNGAVDSIRHNLTWEQARAAEAARTEAAQKRKLARIAEQQRQVEEQRAEALRLQRLMESNSDDEYSQDSELEDAGEESEYEYEYASSEVSNGDSDSEATLSEREHEHEEASPTGLQYEELMTAQLSPPPVIPRRKRLPPRSLSELSFTASEINDTETEISESTESSVYSSAYSEKSKHSRNSFRRRLEMATNAFLALKNAPAPNLTQQNLTEAALLQQQHVYGGSSLYADPKLVSAAKRSMYSTKQHRDYATLEFETILPAPQRTGFRRTANYYDFPDSDGASEGTSEDSVLAGDNLSENPHSDPRGLKVPDGMQYVSASEDTHSVQSKFEVLTSALVAQQRQNQARHLERGDSASYSDVSGSTESVGASVARLTIANANAAQGLPPTVPVSSTTTTAVYTRPASQPPAGRARDPYLPPAPASAPAPARLSTGIAAVPVQPSAGASPSRASAVSPPPHLVLHTVGQTSHTQDDDLSQYSSVDSELESVSTSPPIPPAAPSQGIHASVSDELPAPTGPVYMAPDVAPSSSSAGPPSRPGIAFAAAAPTAAAARRDSETLSVISSSDDSLGESSLELTTITEDSRAPAVGVSQAGLPASSMPRADASVVSKASETVTSSLSDSRPSSQTPRSTGQGPTVSMPASATPTPAAQRSTVPTLTLSSLATAAAAASQGSHVRNAAGEQQASRLDTVHEVESVDSKWTSSSLQAEVMHAWDTAHQGVGPTDPSYLPADVIEHYQSRALPRTPPSASAQLPMGIAEERGKWSGEAAGTTGPVPTPQQTAEEDQRVQAERAAVQQRINAQNTELTRSVESALQQLGPDPAELERVRKEAELEQTIQEAAADSGSEISDYEDELPVDTYLVCGERGKAVDLRDVYDVAVNPDVIYACNADLSGDLLMKFTQQVLLAVPHVNNEQPFPAFDYPILPENYQRRLLVKTHEQLEAEALEAKIKEEERLAAQATSFSTILAYFGFGSWEGAPEAGDSAGADGAGDGAPEDAADETASSIGANIKLPKDEKIDMRPLQMAIPAPVAFKHLTCVSSYRHVVQEFPKGFDDCPEAEHASYDSAKPILSALHKEYEYRSMVHKVKASGSTRQVRFEAAAFDLKSHDEQRAQTSGTPSRQSTYALPYQDDLSSESGSIQAAQQATLDLDDKEYGLVDAGLTLQRIVPKYQRSLTVIAKPAFVIKSRRRKDNREKVFINVLHHVVVDELVESGLVLLDPHEVPLTGVGDSFVCKDRVGVKSIVYNVLIASSYIKSNYRRYERRITDAQCIKQMIEAINDACQESISPDDYTLPRIRHSFKGENPQYLMTYMFKTRKPTNPIKLEGRIARARVRSTGAGSGNTRMRLSAVQEGNEQDLTDSAAEVSEDDKGRGVKAKRGSHGSVATMPTATAGKSKPAPGAGAGAGTGGAAAGTDTASAGAGSGSASVSTSAEVKAASPVVIAHNKGDDKSDSSEEDEDDQNPDAEGEQQNSDPADGKGRFSFNFGRNSTGSPSPNSSNSPAATHRALQQRSSFRLFSGGAADPTSTMITADMITYYKELSIDKALVDRLKHSAVRTPHVLVGWQCVVVLQAGQQAGLFVVTAVRKGTFVKKTEFRLSHPLKEDQWVRLRRSSKKGLYFFPTRKVLFLEHRKQTL